MRSLASTLLTLALVVATPTLAQPDPDSESGAESTVDPETEARAAFQRGATAYRAGDYDAALTEFQRAYQLSDRPQLLYNIGQCYDRLRRDRLAVAAFEAYLRNVEDIPDRATIERRLGILRQQIEEADAERRAEEQAVADARAEEERAAQLAQAAPEPETTSIVEQWWFWTLIGVVVVGAGVGVAIGVTASPGVDAPVPGTNGTLVTALQW